MGHPPPCDAVLRWLGIMVLMVLMVLDSRLHGWANHRIQGAAQHKFIPRRSTRRPFASAAYLDNSGSPCTSSIVALCTHLAVRMCVCVCVCSRAIHARIEAEWGRGIVRHKYTRATPVQPPFFLSSASIVNSRVVCWFFFRRFNLFFVFERAWCSIVSSIIPRIQPQH